MPITYFDSLSGSCNFNPRAAALVRADNTQKLALNLPVAELPIKRIPEASKRNVYALWFRRLLTKCLCGLPKRSIFYF